MKITCFIGSSIWFEDKIKNVKISISLEKIVDEIFSKDTNITIDKYFKELSEETVF